MTLFTLKEYVSKFPRDEFYTSWVDQYEAYKYRLASLEDIQEFEEWRAKMTEAKEQVAKGYKEAQKEVKHYASLLEAYFE